VITAIDAVADQWPKLRIDRSLVLNRQIGDAAACIEPVRSREGGCRTSVEAGAAGAAMVNLRLIDIEIGGREQAAEEEPGTMTAADQIGVLALPSKTGCGGKRLFHDRRSVDEDLDVLTGPS